MKSNDSAVEIFFEFLIGHCNGSMSLKIFVDNSEIFYKEKIKDKILTVQTKVVLPCKISFETNNKNPITDTVLDKNGIVIQDKFIELTKCTLGKWPVNLDKILHGNCYWGLPGLIEINIDESNFLLWHLKNSI